VSGDDVNWGKVAREAAREAHEENFSSRRGLYYDDDHNALIYYNNNPYEHHPSLRDDEMTMLRAFLKERNLEELATAHYPAVGDDAGYTVAMVIAGADEDDVDDLGDKIGELVMSSHAKMSAPAARGEA
jgi:hypothetical protein